MIHINDKGKIDPIKTDIKSLEDWSIKHDMGFEFHSTHKGIKILETPSRIEEC